MGTVHGPERDPERHSMQQNVPAPLLSFRAGPQRNNTVLRMFHLSTQQMTKLSGDKIRFKS